MSLISQGCIRHLTRKADFFWSAITGNTLSLHHWFNKGPIYLSSLSPTLSTSPIFPTLDNGYKNDSNQSDILSTFSGPFVAPTRLGDLGPYLPMIKLIRAIQPHSCLHRLLIILIIIISITVDNSQKGTWGSTSMGPLHPWQEMLRRAKVHISTHICANWLQHWLLRVQAAEKVIRLHIWVHCRAAGNKIINEMI